MFKILILAYVIGQDPIDTQQTFRMGQTFDTMEQCKAELGEFQWDWLMAGCKNDETGEEFSIEPTYPKGKPDELLGLEFKKNYQDI